LDERRAQDLVAAELAERGCSIEWQGFWASTNLYAVLALHKAVAVLGSVLFIWWPLMGAMLHLAAAASYLLDCHYLAFLLRPIAGSGRSQNLLATLPCAGAFRRRVVVLAHADAAPTGWMFQPAFLRLVHRFAPRGGVLPCKHMQAWVVSLLALAGLATIRALTDWWWFPIWYAGLSLGSLIPLVLLLQIVWSRRIVPGANDNLSGCGALVVLAERLASTPPPPGVEIVLVVTGCEESGRGGALALARQMRGRWSTHDTTCLVLDMLSGGELRYHVEGEVWPLRLPPDLEAQLHAIAASDSRFADLRPYHAPAGATDAAPLLLAGYPSVCLSRICPATDLPANYHEPGDRSGNLNWTDILAAVDFAERFVRDKPTPTASWPARPAVWAPGPRLAAAAQAAETHSPSPAATETHRPRAS
jgi:hypothetical protein